MAGRISRSIPKDLRKRPRGSSAGAARDVFDGKILSELAINARLTMTELAERVGLPLPSCRTRVKTLEQSGVIEKYVAVLNYSALGLPNVVFLEVTLAKRDSKALRQFAKALARTPEVLEAHLISGEYDCLVKLAVGEPAEFERFLREVLLKIGGIRFCQTSFSLGALKRSVPIDPGQSAIFCSLYPHLVAPDPTR